MIQKILLFGALLFAGLIAGGQYLVWWDYNPAGVAPAFFVEKIQFAIRVIGTPLFSVQITAAIFTLLSTILFRRHTPAFYLLLLTSGLCIAGVLLTFFGNIPLLKEMATWSIASPPANWLEIAGKWWLIHNVRFAIQLAAFILLILTALSRRDPAPNAKSAG